jgi:hypothetical protein
MRRPLAAARTLALENADTFHFGPPPRYTKDMKVTQLDIAPEEIATNKATEVALVGPRVGP